MLPAEREAPDVTAAEKITRTLRELSVPGDGADAMEMTLASVAMGLESGLAEKIAESQESGELDDFIAALARWIALHRSDAADVLVVVELPRGAFKRHDVPTATGLHRLNEAIALAEQAASPL
jgi:hypothetical protein